MLIGERATITVGNFGGFTLNLPAGLSLKSASVGNAVLKMQVEVTRDIRVSHLTPDSIHRVELPHRRLGSQPTSPAHVSLVRLC